MHRDLKKLLLPYALDSFPTHSEQTYQRRPTLNSCHTQILTMMPSGEGSGANKQLLSIKVSLLSRPLEGILGSSAVGDYSPLESTDSPMKKRGQYLEHWAVRVTYPKGNGESGTMVYYYEAGDFDGKLRAKARHEHALKEGESKKYQVVHENVTYRNKPGKAQSSVHSNSGQDDQELEVDFHRANQLVEQFNAKGLVYRVGLKNCQSFVSWFLNNDPEKKVNLPSGFCSALSS